MTEPATASLLQTMADYRHISSWAVWGQVRPVAPFTSRSDLRLPIDDPRLPGALHGNVVLVALNPGDAAADWDPESSWVNFHAGGRHNDHLLAEALRDTPAWGGYLADLHPTIIESDSTRVRPHTELVTSAVESLVGQIRRLGSPDPMIVCIGKGALAGVTDNLALLRDELRIPEPLVVGIPHYSGANNGVHGGDPARYRALVAAVLNEPFARTAHG